MVNWVLFNRAGIYRISCKGYKGTLKIWGLKRKDLGRQEGKESRVHRSTARTESRASRRLTKAKGSQNGKESGPTGGKRDQVQSQ